MGLSTLRLENFCVFRHQRFAHSIRSPLPGDEPWLQGVGWTRQSVGQTRPGCPLSRGPSDPGRTFDHHATPLKAWRARQTASGSSTTKRLPRFCSPAETDIVPRICSTNCRTMARPRPRFSGPPAFVLTKGSKMLWRMFSGTPTPVSSTVKTARALSASQRMLTRLRSGAPSGIASPRTHW